MAKHLEDETDPARLLAEAKLSLHRTIWLLSRFCYYRGGNCRGPEQDRLVDLIVLSGEIGKLEE